MAEQRQADAGDDGAWNGNGGNRGDDAGSLHPSDGLRTQALHRLNLEESDPSSPDRGTTPKSATLSHHDPPPGEAGGDGDPDVTQVTMFRTKAGKVAVPRFPKGTHIDNWQPRHQ